MLHIHFRRRKINISGASFSLNKTEDNTHTRHGLLYSELLKDLFEKNLNIGTKTAT